MATLKKVSKSDEDPYKFTSPLLLKTKRKKASIHKCSGHNRSTVIDDDLPSKITQSSASGDETNSNSVWEEEDQQDVSYSYCLL